MKNCFMKANNDYDNIQSCQMLMEDVEELMYRGYNVKDLLYVNQKKYTNYFGDFKEQQFQVFISSMAAIFENQYSFSDHIFSEESRCLFNLSKEILALSKKAKYNNS